MLELEKQNYGFNQIKELNFYLSIYIYTLVETSQ